MGAIKSALENTVEPLGGDFNLGLQVINAGKQILGKNGCFPKIKSDVEAFGDDVIQQASLNPTRKLRRKIIDTMKLAHENRLL